MNSISTQFQQFLHNPIFWSAIVGWLSAQFIKTVIKLLTRRIKSFKELIELLFWRTGGMPSSHSSLVSSVCTSIGFKSGFNTDIFILACCFMLVVIRDAVGVRRSSGVQAKAINEIGLNLSNKGIMRYRPIKEIQGHKPLEVVIGCVLGISIGTAFSLL